MALHFCAASTATNHHLLLRPSLSLQLKKNSNPTQHHPDPALSFPSPHSRTAPHPLRVSLHDPPPQTTEHPPQPRDSQSKAGASPLKNSIWINPNSSRASARLRKQASISRYTRLTDIAKILDSCNPTENDVSAVLRVALGENPSEQDTVFILNNAENSETALLGFRWFQKSVKFNREVVLYNVTLKVLRKRRDWSAAEKLFEEMIERGVGPDNVTFATMISCARLCDLPHKAVDLFERLPEFGCTPDDLTFSAMIDAYGRSGSVEKALELYERAKKEMQKLNAAMFTAVIKVYGAVGNFDGALNVYEEMKACSVKPNLILYNTLLDVMGRARRPWHVKTIYKEMVSNGITAGQATFAALLRAYGRARYSDDALVVYLEMKEKGMELNTVLYNTLLSMCADTGHADQALEIFKDMKGSRNGCKPDSWTYSSLITIYSCSGNVSEAEAVLKEMLESGLKPNIFVLTSLIQCYGKARQIDDVVRTFDRLMELGITPDDRFCGCLLDVMSETSREELIKVIGCINRANINLGSLVKNLVDVKISNETLAKTVEEIFSNISGEVKKAYFNCLIDACINLDLLERACTLFNLALELTVYNSPQTKSSTEWSLHVKSLSQGAALTALHVWIGDLVKVLETGEELPPLLGIHTGRGKHKYGETGLVAALGSHLRELNAPFHEAPDKVGWFLTTNIAAKTWLESRSSSDWSLIRIHK